MAEGARITIDAQLQFRHDVEANWLAADPILKVGEPAYTIGYSDRFKLGDGQSKWSELPYLQLGGGGGGGSQAYESLAWSAIKTLSSGDASVLAQAYAVKQAYNELKSLIPNLADYYTKEQINALIPSLEGYATEAWVLGKGYATESFVNTKIADLINGAPTTLDTLKEIADAFAQSQDVIEALDEAIGKKANQSDLTALAARVAANEGNITSLSSNKLDKSIWDSVFEIDAKGNLRAKVGIYSTSFISARTSDPSAGGGGEGGGGAFSLYTWDQVKAMTAEVGGVAPTAYALKQAYNELINATPTLSWNNIQDKPIFANVATSGSYSDLIGRPTSLSDLANDVGYITSAAIPTSYAWSAITGKPSFATVATSGSYNDLSNKPSIPSIAGLASESWVSSNFLGLGGGTISGTGSPLAINSTTSSVWLDFTVNSTNKASIGYFQGLAYISNEKTTARIGIDDSGVAQYWSSWSSAGDGAVYNLIHSGNIGSYNAGSATKLATARTIWGQSFDGTGDVDGDMNLQVGASAFGVGPKIYFNIANRGSVAMIQGKYDAVDWNATNPAAGSLVFSTFKNDTINTSMTINSAGNVLIGTTTDNGAKLQVNGVVKAKNSFVIDRYGDHTYWANGFYIRGEEGTSWGIGAYSNDKATEYYYIGGYGSEMITIKPNGNVGIGTTNDNGAKLYVKDTRTDRLGAALIVDGSGTAYGFGYMGIGLCHNGEGKGGFGWNSVPLSYGANNTAGIFIANDISGDHINLYNEGGIYAYTSLFQTNGNIIAGGTIYSAVGMYSPGYISARSTAGSSDRNLKTNIAPVRNALAYILGTNYVSFDWKDTGEHSVGIIAQDELNREWSCLVQKYSEHYSYQYTQHTALLGSALQEEDEKVEALKTEVEALKTEVQQLRNERQLWQQ